MKGFIMKKFPAMITAAAMMLTAVPAVYAGDVSGFDLSDMGVTATLPESMSEIPGGLFVYPAELANVDPDIYATVFLYNAIDDEEAESLRNLSEDELTDESLEELQQKLGVMSYLLAVDGGREELMDFMSDTEFTEEELESIEEVGRG
ncbi:MAG: hypothetical protein Q4G47_05755, partial [Lachnospiraceae bacterium]|nr:hypothetical protein [Lachnospiraceae bacterium]